MEREIIKFRIPEANADRFFFGAVMEKNLDCVEICLGSPENIFPMNPHFFASQGVEQMSVHDVVKELNRLEEANTALRDKLNRTQELSH